MSQYKDEPVVVDSPDHLLDAGIAEYTFEPASEGGVLGKGKFSTVYKADSADGRTVRPPATSRGSRELIRQYALKHTPLHPHHPLIAARLLREPTLLAQLPPHPCLVSVESWIRTPGHFYLIENFVHSCVPLSEHPSPIAPSRAAYILDQLVSCTRDTLHDRGKVCHRDLKGENVLVNPDTGDLVILDLGLATHFSASEPKLTTCCGSPAFHSPEIVHALNHPPGAVTYYGPELDIWCIALTLISPLLQIRFPLGTSHKHLSVMRDRVLDRLQELDEAYPPAAPWKAVSSSAKMTEAEKQFETSEWRRVRKALADFLQIDSKRRMGAFGRYDIGDRVRARVAAYENVAEGSFKQTTFIPSEPKYTLPIYLETDEHDAEQDEEADAADDELVDRPIVLINPEHESEKKVMSYLKYLLRCRGILYHCLPNTDPRILQLVLPIPRPVAPPPPPLSASPEEVAASGWVANLLSLGRGKRSSSVPAKHLHPPRHTHTGARGRDAAERSWSPEVDRSHSRERWLKCWLKVEFDPSSSSSSRRRAPSRARPEASRQASADTITSRHSRLPRPHMAHTASNGHPHAAAPNGYPVSADVLGKLEELSLTGTTASVRSSSRIRVGRVEGSSGSGAGTGAAAAATSGGAVYLSPLSRQVSPETSTISITAMGSHSRAPSVTRSTTGRAASTSRIPSYRPTNGHGHGHAHAHGAHPRVRLTLSDPRGYTVLRRTLHIPGHSTASSTTLDASSQFGSASATSPTSPSTTLTSFTSPTSPSTDRLAESNEGREARGRGRGRMRSKESVVVLEPVVQNVEMVSPGETSTRVSAVEVPSAASQGGAGKREPSRGRRMGLFEGLFGRRELEPALGAGSRSASVPPGSTPP